MDGASNKGKCLKLSILKYGISLTKRSFIVNLVCSFIFFTLYFMFSVYIIPKAVPSLADNLPIIQGAFSLVAAVALLITGFFINKYDAVHIIYGSSILTSALTALLFIPSNEIFRLVIVFMVGPVLGAGQLAYITYFWNATKSEERGRIGGFLGVIFYPLTFIATTLIASDLDFFGTVALCLFLSLGILLIMPLKPKKALLAAEKTERGNYPEKRTIFLYTIPWIIFSIINLTLAKSVSFSISQQVTPNIYFYLVTLQAFGVIIGALIGGVVADFLGRRLSLAFSLTLYGISSALAGLASITELLFFMYMANGLSWGILLVLYNYVIWGDLAHKENCAKMYSIGLAIFYSTAGIGVILQTLQIPLTVSALASCVLIFFSNVPVILAPELLSPEFRERIKVKSHMESVRKMRQTENQS